jgi:hypothetical protein
MEEERALIKFAASARVGFADLLGSSTSLPPRSRAAIPTRLIEFTQDTMAATLGLPDEQVHHGRSPSVLVNISTASPTYITMPWEPTCHQQTSPNNIHFPL